MVTKTYFIRKGAVDRGICFDCSGYVLASETMLCEPASYQNLVIHHVLIICFLSRHLIRLLSYPRAVSIATRVFTCVLRVHLFIHFIRKDWIDFGFSLTIEDSNGCRSTVLVNFKVLFYGSKYGCYHHGFLNLLEWDQLTILIWLCSNYIYIYIYISGVP